MPCPRAMPGAGMRAGLRPLELFGVGYPLLGFDSVWGRAPWTYLGGGMLPKVVGVASAGSSALASRATFHLPLTFFQKVK
jgi:hypothetical protein